jgi:hypothetical protein
MSRWQKLQPKWQGPFRIKRSSEKGFYKIKDLDGTKIGGTLHGNRLKRFRVRDPEGIRPEDRTNESNHDMEEVFAEEEAPEEEAVA